MTIVQVLWTFLCLVVPGNFSATDDSVRWSESVGGLHGNEFSDEASVGAGQTIGSITICVGRELVNGISLKVIGPKAAKFMHGGSDGEKSVLKLGVEEYVTSMEAHWGEKEGHFQIFYLSFETSAGSSVSGGSMTERKNTVTAPEGFQLGGFFGRDSDAIDKLGVIWTRISTEDPESLGASESEDSAEFSEESAAAESVDTSAESADTPESSDGALVGPTVASAWSEEADSTSTSTDGLGKTPATKASATETTTQEAVESAKEPPRDGYSIAFTKDFTAPSDAGSSIDSVADLAEASALGSAAASTAGPRALTALSEAPAAPPAAPAAPPAASIAPPAASIAPPAASIAPPAAPAAPPVAPPAPAVPTMSVKDSIVLSKRYGASEHGRDFSDQNLVNSGQTVKSISIHAAKRLDGITLTISAPKPLTFTHGGTGGERKELQLGEGEYINSMEVHWGKKDGYTRIFYVNFLTSAGKALSGGSMTSDKSTVTAPDGFQLAGFFGKDGKEIDALGAVWAYIDLVTPAPTPVLPPITFKDLPDTAAEADIAGSLSEVKTKTNKRAVQLSESFGGPHGKQFSDLLAVTSGMTVASVTIRAGKRLDGVTVQVSAPKEMTFAHGGTAGKENTLTLEPGEYITTMEAHWAKKGVNGKTRIFYLSLGTSKGKTVSGGTKTAEKGSVTAPNGYQLAGFFGRDGDEIDHLGAVWSSIAKVNETISPPVSANDDIALSELFGGPHGTAFSDITKIKFGQTVSSVTIRSAKRVDAVTLQIASPLPLTLNHGGGGGTEKTLTLAPDEVITSVEAHWAKKNQHTQVFYICFITSAGNRLAGGTQTDKKGTATAPEGFVLSGFYGRAGGEVDQLGLIWTRKTAKNILLTDPSGVGNSTYGTTIRNWVGPTIGKASDTACYRKTAAFDSANMCPLGYGKEDFDCIVQCPLSYPVECAMECIPQNDDCALAVLAKAGSVVAVALSAATAGVFTSIYKTYETTKWAVMCAKNVYEVIYGIIFYLRYRQTTAPQGDIEELLAVAYQTDLVLYDLPVAIMTCLKMPIHPNAKYGKYVMSIVAGILKAVVTMPDKIISTGANVLSLLSGNGLINDTTITVDEMEDLISKNSSCGYELKRLTDRVTRAVLKYRSTGAPINDIRVKVYDSSIVRNDIPIITNNCMGELLGNKTVMTAYETRDLLRKTFGVIVDQLIDTGKTDNGTNVAEEEYMLEVANMGLLGLSALDPTYISYMASQFVQPLCSPSAYIGEVDDGTLYDALGLQTMDEAFKGSYGSYTHAGDGVIHLIFESVDTKDVTVVIHSGGDDYAKVDVGAGDTTTWDATFSELEDKTLLLDRWRPGIFGLPGSGGGSLLLWIPRSSEGGHITMHVRINPS